MCIRHTPAIKKVHVWATMCVLDESFVVWCIEKTSDMSD